MGYGGSRTSVVQRLRRSGDEGIDGIVNEDPLGLDVVYVQAKRYASDNTVGRERIQQFAGLWLDKERPRAFLLQPVRSPVGAIEFAFRIPQKIILVDGNELTRLMMQYGVGVRTERTIELKRIDLDYFEEIDD